MSDITFELQNVCLNNGVVFFTDYWGRKKFVGGCFHVAVGLDAYMWNYRSIDKIIYNPTAAIEEVKAFKEELKSAKKKSTKGWRESMSECNRFLDTVGRNINYRY